MAKRKKSHRIVIRLSFDKPVSKKQARSCAWDCIHGGPYYPTAHSRGDAEEFRITGVRVAKKAE